MNNDAKILKDLEMVSNNNLLLRAEITEREKQYLKIRRAFNKLLDEHLELRSRCGLSDFNDECQYKWVDEAGLNDVL
jgi:hypothetical protein